MDLTKKAMLSAVHIGSWTGRASDERVINDIAEKHHSQKDMHEYRKVLIKPEALNLIKSARGRARLYWTSNTLPWLDGGTRVLPATRYKEFAAKMREFKADFDKEVENFVAAYDLLKAEARKRLGPALYREEDYPARSELAARFKFEVNVFPIPSSGDWRQKLGEEAEAEMREELAKSTDDAIAKARAIMSKDLWMRIYAEVEAMAEAMKRAKPNFRPSILGNIKAIIAVLPELNVAEDPELTRMGKEIMTAISNLDTDVLREDPVQRKRAANSADAILAKMKGYVGK